MSPAEQCPPLPPPTHHQHNESSTSSCLFPQGKSTISPTISTHKHAQTTVFELNLTATAITSIRPFKSLFSLSLLFVIIIVLCKPKRRKCSLHLSCVAHQLPLLFSFVLCSVLLILLFPHITVILLPFSFRYPVLCRCPLFSVVLTSFFLLLWTIRLLRVLNHLSG